MGADSKKTRRPLLILTSTFPRWKDDSTPSFVQAFAQIINTHISEVYVLAPHAEHSKTKEHMEPNVTVFRYRYFFPASEEDIAYEGGGHTKVSFSIIYLIKLGFLLLSQFIYALYFVLFKGVRTINAHWIIPQGFIALLVKIITFGSVKVVITVHGKDILGFNKNPVRMVKKFVLKYADEVVVNSSVTLEASQVLIRRPYHLIPMGVDFSIFSSKHPLKKVDGRSSPPLNILFVGRFSKEKGTLYLCEALDKLKGDGVSFKCLMIGEGPEKNKVSNFITSRGLTKNVELLGWIKHEDLVKHYSQADIFVGPSIEEALGLVFLESLASGTPIIATSVGGIRDVLKDGVNGFAIPAKSSEAIYEKLSLLSSDRKLLNDLQKNAAPSVAKRYSWKSIAKKYAEILG